MNIPALRAFLMQWQYWALEGQFLLLVLATAVEVPRLRVRGSTVAAACGVAVCAAALTATVPARTNRIFFDEHIYQGVGRNLSDLHRAQMCSTRDQRDVFTRFRQHSASECANCARADYRESHRGTLKRIAD